MTKAFVTQTTQVVRGTWQTISPQYPGVIGAGKSEGESEADFFAKAELAVPDEQFVGETA